MSRGPRLLPEPVGQKVVGLGRPACWTAIFGFSGPLELEIGCGKGGYALAYAQLHPNICYIAFEWRKKWARDVARRAGEKELRNLYVIEADARREIPTLFEANSISGIHLQFPDPWWKRAHHKRAIVQPEFVRILYEKCTAGGYFEFRTDVEDRAGQIMSVLETAGFQNPLGAGKLHPADPFDPPSSRERRYLASGAPVFRARLFKPTLER